MISVVIPTHNRVDLLKRAIESVLNQSFNDFEIIVVSDGSTDGTDELMETFDDERVRYYKQFPAQGANVARNKGVSEAKFEYVAFLDDDDEWTEHKLISQLEIFKSSPDVGLVYTGVQQIFVDDNVSYITKPTETGDLSNKILIRNYIGTTSSVMAKTDIVRQVGAFDTKLGAQQDYDLWIRICQKTQIGAVDKPCVKYYNYTNSNQISKRIDKHQEASKKMRQKYETLFSKLTKNEMRLKTSISYLSFSRISIRNGDAKLARKFAKKSFKHQPSLQALILYFGANVKYSTIIKFRGMFTG